MSNKKIVIGIAGEIASGKETVAEYLVEKYHAKKFRMSDILKNILERVNLGNNRKNLGKLSLALRESFGQDVLIHALIEDIKGSDADIVIIDGIRRMAELEHLSNLDNFKFIYLKADLKKRYERLIQRGEKQDDNIKTFEEFKKDHQIETETTILELEDKAGTVITNNGTLEDLYKKIDSVLNEFA